MIFKVHRMHQLVYVADFLSGWLHIGNASTNEARVNLMSSAIAVYKHNTAKRRYISKAFTGFAELILAFFLYRTAKQNMVCLFLRFRFYFDSVALKLCGGIGFLRLNSTINRYR